MLFTSIPHTISTLGLFYENHPHDCPERLVELWFDSIEKMKLLEIYRLLFTNPQLIKVRSNGHLVYPVHSMKEANHCLGPATSNMNSLQVAMLYFYSAKEYGNHEEINLRKAVVDIVFDASNEKDLATDVWGDRNTTLHLAAFMNDEELVHLLLQKGCTPDTTNQHGYSCLGVTSSPIILDLFRRVSPLLDAAPKHYPSTLHVEKNQLPSKMTLRSKVEQDHVNEFLEIPSLNQLLSQRDISPPWPMVNDTTPSSRKDSTLHQDITNTLLTTDSLERKVYSQMKKSSQLSTNPASKDKGTPDFYSSMKKKGSTMMTIHYKKFPHFESIKSMNISQFWKKIKPHKSTSGCISGSDMDIENFNIVHQSRMKWSWNWFNTLNKSKAPL
ncbi:hypothetical protein K7432_001712 [Basidiobolus ranarum]|uniref:Uncharacterized protein n=1 Tax=Basidiobolus ranarum TaxID=34480 RepID=A0ABR2W908_9FUNG